MSSQNTFLNVLKYDNTMAKASAKVGAEIKVAVAKVTHPDGNWNYTMNVIKEDVKQGIESLKENNLKTDVFKKAK